MDLNDLELIEAARAQGVNIHRAGVDTWEIGMAVRADPLTPSQVRMAETFLSGGRIRLQDGREFPRVMTTDEARRTFGLDA